MLKSVKPKLLCVLLAVIVLSSCILTAVNAVTDQDKAQISVAVSENNPQIGDVITVVVSIDNYPTMSPRISAMYISLSFDTNCFEYVENSAESVLKVNKDDITSVSYDESETVRFSYVYANSKRSTLPTTAKNIFTFKLRVRDSVTEKTDAVFTVNEMELYNGKDDRKYTQIECKAPKTEDVVVWPKRPVILLNGTNEYESAYSEDVTVTFDASSASLIYDSREAVNIKSGYVCNKNGRYTVSVVINGETTSLTFDINKEISNISVKAGTYRQEYPLGIELDYSGWILLVTYRDGSHSEIAMSDPDITVEGYEKDSVGTQRVLVRYRSQTTSVNIKVSAKEVESFTIKSNIAKTKYLTGDDVDPAGGTLIVFYDDKSSEEIEITFGMLSGYDKSYVGDQAVTVKYGELTQTLNVTYYSREAADELNLELANLDLNAITLDSREMITDILQRYNTLNDTQKEAVTNISIIYEAREIYNQLADNANKQDHTQSTKEEDKPNVTTSDPGVSKEPDLKIIWYLVAGIVGLSVVGGIIYFLAVYFKRKRELNEDEYYYDEEDEEDDGDLSYDDDAIDDIDDEEDEDDDK